MSGRGLASRGYAAGPGGGGGFDPLDIATLDPNLIEQTALIGRAMGFHEAFDEIIAAINNHAALIAGDTVDPDILDQDSDIGVAKIVHDALVVIFAVLNEHATLIAGADTIDPLLQEQAADVGESATLREGVQAVIDTINQHAIALAAASGSGSIGLSLETRGYV